jgi:tetratricopeptide (TPR) repeat protein
MAILLKMSLTSTQSLLLLFVSAIALELTGQNVSAQEPPPATGLIEASPEASLAQSPLVSKGYELLADGDTDGALERFQAALEQNEQDLSAKLGEAMILSELQRYPEAFNSYDTIVKTYPRHAFAWNGRGLAAFNMEDFDTALSSFKQATADHPVNGFFYESLAWAQMCRGDYDQAAESAKMATLMYNKKSESSVYPLLIAYFSYLETGDQVNAQNSLNYAVANKPHYKWPAPVIDYLTDTIDATELISYVTDTTQETEAHTYIGLKLRATGKENAARPHLEWVAKHGDSRVFEYTLARALNLHDSVALLTPSR